MTYFSRRNEYLVEYSGHEEISKSLRERLILIFNKYIGHYTSSSDRPPWFIETKQFTHNSYLEFPSRDPFSILANGEFHEVLTLVEIFLDMTKMLTYERRNSAPIEILQAFNLSGSVYEFNDEYKFELKIDENLVEKIESIKPILQPFPEFYNRFFQAVGNLVGRKAKPEDVVKDIYVASEGYLKKITKTSRFGDAIKELSKSGKINKEQKKVLEALNEFRSDSDGAGHAGNSDTPTEETALWFIDTMVAQLRMINNLISK